MLKQYLLTKKSPIFDNSDQKYPEELMDFLKKLLIKDPAKRINWE
jgi:hypothetical protein